MFEALMYAWDDYVTLMPLMTFLRDIQLALQTHLLRRMPTVLV